MGTDGACGLLFYAAKRSGDTAEHNTSSVQPIRSEKIKQWPRDRPRYDALVLRAAPAFIEGLQLK